MAKGALMESYGPPAEGNRRRASAREAELLRPLRPSECSRRKSCPQR